MAFPSRHQPAIHGPELLEDPKTGHLVASLMQRLRRGQSLELVCFEPGYPHGINRQTWYPERPGRPGTTVPLPLRIFLWETLRPGQRVEVTYKGATLYTWPEL